MLDRDSNNPYVTCRSAEGLSQVCHRSVQWYSRPIWRKTEVCKSAYCLWQTSHENDCFFDCVLPFILFAASLLQTFRDFWWLCNKDLLLCLHLICSRRCADNQYNFVSKQEGTFNFCDLYIMLYYLGVKRTSSTYIHNEQYFKLLRCTHDQCNSRSVDTLGPFIRGIRRVVNKTRTVPFIRACLI